MVYLGGVEEELEEVAPARGTGPPACRRHLHRIRLIHGSHGGAPAPEKGTALGRKAVAAESRRRHGEQVKYRRGWPITN
jgi:hypothetical protein